MEEKIIKDEYGLERPSENVPLGDSYYKLVRKILEAQKLVNENYELARKAYYYKMKSDLYLMGIKENPFYSVEESSSISKYIYEPIFL